MNFTVEQIRAIDVYAKEGCKDVPCTACPFHYYDAETITRGLCYFRQLYRKQFTGDPTWVRTVCKDLKKRLILKELIS